MGREQWLQSYKGASSSNCIFLEPGYSKEEIALAEAAFGKPLPLAARATLEYWNERGSEFLLNDLPRILNPTASDQELNPAAPNMVTLFPGFSQALSNTRQFAIIVDPSRREEEIDTYKIYFTGLLGEKKDSKTKLAYWVTHLPQTLETITQQEAKLGFKLSNQYKQLILRVNGSPNEGWYPYFSEVEEFEYPVLADFYKDIDMEDELGSEIMGRMEAFRTLYEDFGGGYYGFFIDEQNSVQEYKIYEWATEYGSFSLRAPDFAQWFNKLIENP